MLGYYFGFRVEARTAGGRMYDPSATQTQPLHLPGGISTGIGLTGGAYLSRGERVRGACRCGGAG